MIDPTQDCPPLSSHRQSRPGAPGLTRNHMIVGVARTPARKTYVNHPVVSAARPVQPAGVTVPGGLMNTHSQRPLTVRPTSDLRCESDLMIVRRVAALPPPSGPRAEASWSERERRLTVTRQRERDVRTRRWSLSHFTGGQAVGPPSTAVLLPR